jgi:septal ring factor EnvC (AmiA/AmiB activator)
VLFRSALLLLALTATELLLLFVVIAFYLRLRRSEALIARMQAKQEEFLVKLRANAQIEQELVDSFSRRQDELARLDSQLTERVVMLNKLLKQADEYTKSPQFLRQVVITGHRQGKNAKELARATGISEDEVELIIDQSGS